MDALLADLRRLSIGATYNQFQGPGGEQRLENVRNYVTQRLEAPVVAVGEANGYQGARWSGIAFTSERDLLRWGPPFRTTSDRPNGWSEPSGTIVHRTLDELAAEHDVVLWNTVPTHPFVAGRPLSNRRPNAAEVAAGVPYLERVLAMIAPRVVVGVGRISQAALTGLGVEHVPVRHPSHGGATEFAAGMREVIEGVRAK